MEKWEMIFLILIGPSFNFEGNSPLPHCVECFVTVLLPVTKDIANI